MYSRSKNICIAVILLSLVVVILSCIIQNQVVFAQSVKIQKTKGLTLSPLRSELEIAPGTSLGGTLTVTNSTDKPMKVDFSAEEFSVIDSQYDYDFNAQSDVAKWATFNPSEVNLTAGQSMKVKYTVGVPLSAEPGGYYISLFASTAVGQAGDEGNSRQRVASLLYTTVYSDVLGAATKVGHVLNLSSPWLVTDKGSWGMMLQNKGTVHFRSNYSINVQDLFGGKVGEYQKTALILPNTVRALSGELPMPSIPGIYKIIYNIGLGDIPNITVVRYMLFLPLWFITIATAAIVATGYWLLRKINRKH